MRIRSLLPGLLATAALLLAACGGGGGGGSGPSASTALLSGRVTLRDGTTSNLSGLRITLTRTGETVTTGGTGAFDFGSVPTGTLALRVTDPLAATRVQAQGTSGDDASDDGDDATDDDAFDDGDDHDVGDDDLDVVEVEDGEEIEIEIEVHDGRIEAVSVSRSGDDDLEAEVRLDRAASSDDPDVEGKAELESRTDRQKLEVEADHLAVGRTVRAVVICEGQEADLGVRTADAEGEAEWEIATNDGGVLPFGAVTVDELVGCVVEVRDATDGTVLLAGTLPEIPTSVDGVPGDDGDGDESKGRALLAPQNGATGEAYVEVEVRVEDGATEQQLEAEIEGQAPGLVVELWIANAGAVLEKVGTFAVGDGGEGEIEFETDDEGGALPFGVTDVNDLVGRAVELRDASDGSVLFSGTVPAPVGS